MKQPVDHALDVFGFTHAPFSRTPKEPYLDEDRQLILKQLERFLQYRGFAVVTGTAGCGKTSMLHHLAGALHPSANKIMYVPFSILSDSDMLRTFCHEMELERAMITRMNRFLIEMGGSFAFMGNQYRLEIDGHEFFIDILLYHRKLKCLIAVELKAGKFQPEFVGKIQFYLAALDDRVRIKGENPAIGIILCKEKNRTIVEYALRETKKPIGVAKYHVVQRLPKELKGELPSAREIEELLSEM